MREVEFVSTCTTIGELAWKHCLSLIQKGIFDPVHVESEIDDQIDTAMPRGKGLDELTQDYGLEPNWLDFDEYFGWDEMQGYGRRIVMAFMDSEGGFDHLEDLQELAQNWNKLIKSGDLLSAYELHAERSKDFKEIGIDLPESVFAAWEADQMQFITIPEQNNKNRRL